MYDKLLEKKTALVLSMDFNKLIFKKIIMHNKVVIKI